MNYIAPVAFNTGDENLDSFFSSKSELVYYFNAVNLSATAKTAEEQGVPIIFPSEIKVGVFADFDNKISYAVRSYKELDQGRMQLSDFVVKQAWQELDDKQILLLRNEEGEIIDRKIGMDAIYLASIADFYRFAHTPEVKS